MSLLLLVHLYILNHPLVNNPEYDHDLFNPRARGLRDRTKAMEDITYFLVGKIEGGSSKLLPMYPCRQPSESLAFRTSLTKYLEQLRHQSIYPPRQGDPAVPWWRNVVVRKSLLEESAGEKFDRLMLSLSTHALMKASLTIPQDMMSALLRSEPVSYTNALVKYQSIRHSWTTSASSLLRRQHDLRLLRVNQSTQLSSKYEGVPTPRLITLAQSKYQDLMNSCVEQTRPCLASFIELAGLGNSNPLPVSTRPVDAQHTSLSSQPSPLPTAAAHHPSYLRKFKHPLFSKKPDSEISLPVKSHAGMVLAVQIEAERRIQQSLVNALSRTGNRRLELRKAIMSKVPRPLPNTVVSTFLQPLPSTFDIDYDPKPTKELLILLGMEEDFDALELVTEIGQELEKRVSNIRSSILPPFPTISDDLFKVPRLQITLTEPTRTRTGISRIPQPQKHSSNLKALSIRGKRRKSVRFSTARRLTGRPSIFGAFEELENSIDCLINQTHDFPTDDEDSNTDHEGMMIFSSPYKTPKDKRRKTPKVNRIWLPGTPASKLRGFEGRTPKKHRESEALVLERLFEDKLPPGLELPSGLDTLDDISDQGEDDDDDDEDGFLANDPPSMTLKEILLTADTSQFDLMADVEDERLESGFLENEMSFSWE